MSPLLRGRAAAGGLAAVGICALAWGVAGGRDGLAMAGGVALAGLAVAYLLPLLPWMRSHEPGAERDDSPGGRE